MQVTRNIKHAVNPPAFRDARFMSELDVVFANMYFAAIAAGDVDPSHAIIRVASAFACAAEVRDCPFAVRAVRHERAHQSRPPQSIVQVCEVIGGEPTSDEARRQDFDSVNELLERVEDELKADFSVGVTGVVDIAAGRVDDVVAMWNVPVARKAAWTNADVLWALRHAPHIRSALLDTLDRFTVLAGRGLLIAQRSTPCLRSSH